MLHYEFLPWTIHVSKRNKRFLHQTPNAQIALVSEKIMSTWNRSKINHLKKALDTVSDSVHQFGTPEAIKAHDYMFQACQRRLKAIREQESRS
jgi:hypothetical protein